MARKVFYSFHFQEDCWRTGQVRNIGTIEGNKPIRDNDWEEVKRKGDNVIKNWIDNQLYGTSCVVVLIGNQTANRKWVKYEIQRAWEMGKGVLGIYIHKLLDQDGKDSVIGLNPFRELWVETKGGRKNLEDFVHVYYPLGNNSKEVYREIEENLAKWVEGAIIMRALY